MKERTVMSGCEAGAARRGEPNVREVREVLRGPGVVRSAARGLAVFAGSFAGFCAALAVTLTVEPLWIKTPMSVLTGALIAALFVVGHDACHQALTPHGLVNRVVGRLAFLPSLHPYTTWEHTHNGLHHAYTNIRSIDPVFPPLSLEEYRRLSVVRRCWERVMRFPATAGFLYICKVWLPYELRRGTTGGVRGPRRAWYLFDVACVATWSVTLCGVCILVADRTGQSPWQNLALGAALPVAVFMWLMAWVVHIHHTHPKVPWFADRREYTYFRAQVRAVVHMELPRPVEVFLHNIMDHTAHHADPKVPLYELHEAQQRLEAAYPLDVVHERFTIRGWLRIFRVCRLYDYEQHRWLDWDGTPLTPCLMPQAV